MLKVLFLYEPEHIGTVHLARPQNFPKNSYFLEFRVRTK